MLSFIITNNEFSRFLAFFTPSDSFVRPLRCTYGGACRGVSPLFRVCHVEISWSDFFDIVIAAVGSVCAIRVTGGNRVHEATVASFSLGWGGSRACTTVNAKEGR